MDIKQYTKEFREKAENVGFSEEIILACLKYAGTLFANKVPVIYTTNHLSALVGYKKNYIKRAVWNTQYFYRDFFVDKKNGGKRKISEPLPSLKEIQVWILENILYNIPVSRYAKAYVRKKTIIENVRFHKKQKKVLSLDVKNFFPSITVTHIEKVFNKIGYSSIIANLLAKLCCLANSLPQGAPTSPCLSNIIMNSFDNNIAYFCKKRNIKFTRYADDLTFSSDEESFDTDELISLVKEKLFDLGMELNEEKTKLMTDSQRQIVTGIVVNEKIQAPKEKRKNVRQIMYYIQKFGVKKQLEYLSEKNKEGEMQKEWTEEGYIKHLIGTINYMLYLNPMDKELIKYKLFLRTLKK